MILENLKKLLFVFLLGMISFGLEAYPIDGYTLTGIRRLLYLQLVMKGELKATLPLKGAQRSINDITLNLSGERGDSLQGLPLADPFLQKSINQIFPNPDESYSIAVLDITPRGKETVPARKCWKVAGCGRFVQ